MGEPKKFSFGFSKVVKKPSLVQAKPVDTEQVEYIKCVEDKTVKLVNEEANKPKPLPVIPMPPGSSVRDRILEAIKAREEAKSGRNSKAKENGVAEENGSKSEVKVEGSVEESNAAEAKPLTLDEMAAKELLESAKMEATEEKKPDLVIAANANDAVKKEATLDDYENMPIGDFGLAMLRGMGWDPKKGIGLNEKVVVPTAPQVRPKGMGLGADKALAAQNPQSKAAEELVMKKGSTVKVVVGPNAGLYGKVEMFEDLPGRIAVRLALSNSVLSLSEFMVQLVGPTEYAKNAKVMNLDKYNAALDVESKPVKSEEPKHHRSRSPRDHRDKFEEPKYRRSRSPRDHRDRSDRDRSRDRTSLRKSKHRRDSPDYDDHRRKKEERRPLEKSKKSKYHSDSSESDSKPKKKSSRDKSHKHSKSKSYRSESDSDSNSRHHKKHKKSRKH